MAANFEKKEDRPYADGRAAKVWHIFVGGVEARLACYRGTLLKILKDHAVRTVYDVACGVGIDSLMLLDEGYEVVSSDADDNFLRKAREVKQERPELAGWQIGVGDWLDLESAEVTHPEEGYDAIICIGNSIVALPDFEGENRTHVKAIQNFKDLLKVGGVLIIDHRNFDLALANRETAPKSRANMYYQTDREFNLNEEFVEEEGRVVQTIFKSYLDVSGTDLENDSDVTMQKRGEVMVPALEIKPISFYPFTVAGFTASLKKVFGEEAQHRVLPDFKDDSDDSEPQLWVHVIIKS